jgi:hypothetical protein
MGSRPRFELAELIEQCERFYARDGFVKFADVAKALGVSRQAVQLRLARAVERGELDAPTLERYRSPTSRAAVARERRKASEDREAARRQTHFYLLLTPENAKWVRTEAAFRRLAFNELINGLVTQAREQAETPPSP